MKNSMFLKSCCHQSLATRIGLPGIVVSTLVLGLGRSVAQAQVTVHTIDPSPTTGKLVRFDLRGEAVLRSADGHESTVPSNEVVRIVAEGRLPTTADAETSFTLAGGDRLYGAVAGRGEDVVEVDSESLGTLRIPLDALREIHLQRATSSGTPQDEPGDELTNLPADDRALLTNGDQLRGLVVAIDESGVTLEGPNGAENLPWSVIERVRMSGVTAPRPSASLAVVRTVSGERLTCRELRWFDDVIEGEHIGGFRFSLPSLRIVSVEVLGGRWRWLSELEPVSFEHTPMLGVPWPYRVNRNVIGEAMLVNGEAYERGIGVHSRTSLIYELQSQYLELVTAMGIDDRSGPLADVSAAILVDGVRAYSKTGLQAGELVGPVRVDVRRAGRVEFIVDYGRNGDLQDRFNWIEAGLVRAADERPGDSPSKSERGQHRQ